MAGYAACDASCHRPRPALNHARLVKPKPPMNADTRRCPPGEISVYRRSSAVHSGPSKTKQRAPPAVMVLLERLHREARYLMETAACAAAVPGKNSVYLSSVTGSVVN